MSQLKEEFRRNGYVVLRKLLPTEEGSFYREKLEELFL